MLDLKFTVAERDLDLLVLEELEISEVFRRWFASRVYEIPVFKSRIGSWHSVSDSEFGESDLVFIFEANDDSRKSVLIENKIDAPPQPDQGARYRQRGENGIADGNWDEFRTCIIAPKRYLLSTKHAEIYDAEVSYEEIMAHFISLSAEDPRCEFRANFLLEGIEQNRRGYQPRISKEMTSYVQDYVEYVGEHFPDLGVEKPKPRPAGSTWIMYYPPGLSKGVSVHHKLTAGQVKVLLSGKATEVEHFQDKYRDEQLPDFQVQKAGKSLGLAVTVHKVDPITETFEETKDRVHLALDRLAQLTEMTRRQGDL